MQKFFDKTPDSRVVKNSSNCCEKRSIETFMASRTTNPMAYTNQANILMLGTEKEKNQLQRCLKKNLSFNQSITGCSKYVNPEASRTTFKMCYDENELLDKSVPKVHSIKRLEDNFRDCSTPRKEVPAVLGGSRINTYLLDNSQLNHDSIRKTKLIKNMKDFRSNITCLSNDKSINDQSINASCHEKKLYRNLLTSFETQDMVRVNGNKQLQVTIHEQRPQKKRVQQPYQTKEIKTKKHKFNFLLS